MSLGLEIDFDLYGSPEEYTAALKEIDAILKFDFNKFDNKNYYNNKKEA